MSTCGWWSGAARATQQSLVDSARVMSRALVRAGSTTRPRCAEAARAAGRPTQLSRTQGIPAVNAPAKRGLFSVGACCGSCCQLAGLLACFGMLATGACVLHCFVLDK